ncbi:hypothetical protein P9209_16775 [Prescottella defluvii]|nr:hypothetical protein P9209_16775 [Prescottella defluvii]
MGERIPSWIELMGRHAASSSSFVSAVLRYEARSDDSDTAERGEFGFRYGPGHRWRIDRAGRTVFVSSPQAALLRKGDTMERLPGSFHLVDLGPISPMDVVGPDTLLHSLSRRTAPTGPATAVGVEARPAWELSLLSGAGEEGHVTVVIDDETGLLVRVDSTETNLTAALADLQVHDTLAESTFAWDGPITDIPPDLTDPLTVLEQRREIIRAIATALEHRELVVSVVASSTDTEEAHNELMGRLDVTNTGADAILRYPAALGSAAANAPGSSGAR